MALLFDEDGREVVAAALTGRSAISAVNWAEVLSKVAERGGEPAATEAEYREHGLIGEALEIEPLTASDCAAIGRLRPLTKAKGLSLADRACLALAERLGVPALSADGAWAEVDIDVDVTLIR